MKPPSHRSLQSVMVALGVLILSSISSAAAPGGPDKPVDLRCEYLTNPMGVDVKLPRFFWVDGHSERGQAQSAFQVIVSTSPDAGEGDMWDSGKVASGSSIQVAYSGKPLASGRAYYWKVRWWDKDGLESPWSSPASFTTGLLARTDWKGTWIGGKGLLRREFALDAAPKRALVHYAGIGYSELRINSRKVGGNVLDPGWTTYDKRVLYVTHDITRMLRKGPNALGVLLGHGWFKSRALLLELDIELEDGKHVEVASDASWKSSDGPIVEDSIYNGETYDARLEMPGWDTPGFDDKTWTAAETVKAPGGELSAQLMPAIQVVETLLPLKMSNPEPGVYVFDMGQNFSGWARLRATGPAGTDVRLRFSELIYPDGRINQENLRGARAEDHYILKGDGEESWEPRFTYHGFRYVELTGYPGTPKVDTIHGRVVHTAVKPVGSFASSKPILNDLQRNIVWGQKTNLHSVPTDCDQRDERMGWMADAQGSAEEAMLNFDMAAFYTNFVRDIRDVQDEKGQITDTVPYIWGTRPADPAWGTAYPLICWYMYRYYGDTRILDENYTGLKKYVELLKSKSENGILRFSNYGDWVAIEKCPSALVSTFYYYYDTKILADTARILGKAADAKLYDDLAGRIKAAFHKEFFDPGTQSYGPTQTANTLPLFLDLAPGNAVDGAWDRLINDIVYGHDSHLTTGIIGTKCIMELLTRSGRAHLAYDIATQTTYPSWGYMIANGATTIWELWQKREGPSMNSHNHPMFGSVGAWLYKALAGIDQAGDSAGFAKLVLRPRMVRDLVHASGSTRTVRGEVWTSWSRTDRCVRLEVLVPVGSEAEVAIPRFNLRNIVVREGSTALWTDGKFVPGVQGISGARDVADGAEIVIQLGSGKYAFELTGD
jgi:alpha-L-rhamnosidase